MSDEDIYGDTLAPAEAAKSTADFPTVNFGERYLVSGELGRGGMGTVYRAFDTELREDVALKALLPSLAQDRRALLRFRHEVRIARRVSHPNIARIHDFHIHNDVPFLTMELVPGQGLDDLLARAGVLSVEQMLAYMLPVFNALTAAHQAGVVHRDLKPANVLVTADGRVVVTDFGIATMAGDVADQGQIVGTPLYMSPEQARALPVDARSDLYSAGVMMHVMLTGKSPWDADDAMSLIMARLLRPPGNLPDEVPEHVRTVISQLLEVEPRQRPDSAETVVTALRSQSNASASTSTSTSQRLTALPHRLGKFVGREDELQALQSNLTAKHCAVICGPGGIGKSRLALAFAQRSAERTAWVDLRGADTLDAAMALILASLGLPASAGLQELTTHVGDTPVLWVFDGVDKLDLSTLAGPFLSMHGRVLLTQRTRASQFFSLQLDPLDASAATALFVDRASMRGQDNIEEQEALTEVLGRLEGYPLALELAASRLGMMTLPTLAKRLSDPMRTLRNKELGSMEAAIADSWHELDDDIQSGLAQFAVFEGGASLDDVCEVLQTEAFPEDLIEELIDRSLVRWSRDDDRFSCFDVIRDFARSQLPDALEAAAVRHRDRFVVRAQADPSHEDLANLRAAFEHALSSAERTQAESLLLGVWHVLERNGPYSMGQVLGERLLSLTDSEVACRVVGWSHWRSGRLEAAADAFDRALALRETPEGQMGLGQVRWSQGRLDEAEVALQKAKAGRPTTVANTLNVLGLVEWNRGNLDAAHGYLEQAAAAFASSLPAKQGVALSNLALVEFDREEVEAAVETTRRAIDLLKLANDRRSVALAQSNLGNMLRTAGQLDQAVEVLFVAVEANRRLGDVRMMGFSKMNLGIALADQGRHQEAIPMLREAIAHFEGLHQPEAVAEATERLAASLRF